jgi:hypothetical protein
MTITVTIPEASLSLLTFWAKGDEDLSLITVDSAIGVMDVC